MSRFRGRAIVLLSGATLVSVLSGCTGTGTAAPVPTASPIDAARTPIEAGAPARAVVSMASVDVTATSATVAGYVTSISEEDGACLFTLDSLDGRSIVVEALSAANVGTTSCGTQEVPLGSLSRGTWTVTLAYSSDDQEPLISEPLTMEVP